MTLEGNLENVALITEMFSKTESRHVILLNMFGEISGVTPGIPNSLNIQHETINSDHFNFLIFAPKLVTEFLYNGFESPQSAPDKPESPRRDSSKKNPAKLLSGLVKNAKPVSKGEDSKKNTLGSLVSERGSKFEFLRANLKNLAN